MSDSNEFKPPGTGAFWDNYANAGKSMQTFATEVQRASKESLESTTKMIEQLRNAKSMEEVVSIQTQFMQQSFTSYADTTRRLSELMMAVPMELAKQSQSAFQQNRDAMTKVAEQATEQMRKASGHE